MNYNGLIELHQHSAILSPQYFGSVEYYALYALFGKVYVDTDMRADKRFKTAHRCRIVDARDEINLTVPVCPPHGDHSWNETIVSTHGKWWNIHRTALESAYGRTPFFEYYIDRFSNIFDGERYLNGEINVGQLDKDCDMIVRQILGLENKTVYGSCESAEAADLRKYITPVIHDTEYYQIRASRLGFKAGMSIVDLIFNMGPESPLVLKRMQTQIMESLLKDSITS